MIGHEIALGARKGPGVDLVLGTCQAVDWPTQTASVLLVGSTVPIQARMSGQVPRVAEPVWVLILGTTALTMGRPSRPAMGKVVGTATAGRVSVLATDGVTYNVGFATGYTPVDGHSVLLDWDEGGHIIARTDVVAPPPPPGVDPGGATTMTRKFNATASGSRRRGGGWQSGSVYFGSSFSSAGYLYGAQIANTIPDTAEVTAVSVYLEVSSASGASTMSLSLHTSADVPSGDLALDQTIDIGAMPNGFRGDVRLPNAWGDLLKTGARLGIGTAGAGLRILKGVPTSGTLTITTKE